MYVDLAEIPVPLSAEFTGPNVVRVTASVRDHVQNVKRTMVKSVTVAEASVVASNYEDVGNAVAFQTSPSGKRRAIFWETKNATSSKRRIEIWHGARLEASLDVTNVHDGFYTDEAYSSFSFSDTEDSLLYTAEGKLSDSPPDPYTRFRFTPHLGESLVGKCRPTLFLYTWTTLEQHGANSRTSKIARVYIPTLERSGRQTASAPILYGQVIFHPSDKNRIYATGYERMRDGRLLGVKYCQNRPSGIWELSLSNEDRVPSDMPTTPSETVSCQARKLTPSHLSCRSPRIISDQGVTSLFWLSTTTGGPHAATSSLHSLDITHTLTNSVQINNVVDVVSDPRSDEFPGLYPSGFNLPLLPFVCTGTLAPSIAISSIWGSRSTVLLISGDKGSVRDFTPNIDGSMYSWAVLSTDGWNRILCTRSSTNVPPEIVLGELDANGAVSWKVIEKPSLSPDIESALSKLKTEIISIPSRAPTEAILIRSSDTTAATPCITFAHGGPHGTMITAFSAATTAYALEGYTISIPNYTGSLGFGETAVRALIGQCGTLDVEDCMATVRHLVSEGYTSEGPGKQLVMGGSHGGFLTAHMIGQYPNMFTASVLRNPVISAGEIANTDIPDWYFSEFGFEYPLSSSAPDVSLETTGDVARTPLLTPEIFTKLQDASPIRYAKEVKTPVLLLIGAADLRVSPTQGIGYYHALKGYEEKPLGDAKSKVEMLVFEGENHALDGVEAARVVWEAGRDWFADSLKSQDVETPVGS